MRGERAAAARASDAGVCELDALFLRVHRVPLSWSVSQWVIVASEREAVKEELECVGGRESAERAGCANSAE